MNALHPAQICVARHGETDWNAAEVLQGWTDVEINDKGRRQAHELALALAPSGFDLIYSSPLLRAQETAEIIAGELRLAPPLIHPGLKERHFGAIQGIPKPELAELNPVLLQQILKRNPACTFPQGESMNVFADRVLHAVTSIGMQHPGKRVLVITHGWVIDVIVRHVANLPRSTILDRKRKNGEFLWLEVTEELVRLLPTEAC
jgi:probable phosphoglycerate mutase